MRRYLILLLPALLLACGGGGGGGGGDDPSQGQVPGDNGGPPDNQAIALQILEDSGFQELQDFLETSRPYLAMFDKEEPERPPYQFTAVNLLDASATWRIDLSAGDPPEVTGRITFRDETGFPTRPFDLNFLLKGLNDLSDVSTTFPDGTRVRLEIDATPAQGYTAEFLYVFQGGRVDRVSGMGGVTVGDCTGNFDFDQVDPNRILKGDYPAFVLRTFVQSPDGGLDGLVSLDGTKKAIYDVRLDGGEERYRFEADLDTGEIQIAAD